MNAQLKKLHHAESRSYDYYKKEGSAWTVAICNDGSGNSYFEHTSGDSNSNSECSGILEFESKTLVDYDGVYELPKTVCQVLHSLGYKFAEFVLPDGLTF